jgi:hypothetical protein
MTFSRSLRLRLSVSTLGAALLLAVAAAAPARAAAPKTYQVTGPVLEVTDSTVTVEKGKEKWQLARDKDTKVSGGDLKVGDKVTIEYRMTATSIDVKGAAGAKDTKATDKKAK